MLKFKFCYFQTQLTKMSDQIEEVKQVDWRFGVNVFNNHSNNSETYFQLTFTLGNGRKLNLELNLKQFTSLLQQLESILNQVNC